MCWQLCLFGCDLRTSPRTLSSSSCQRPQPSVAYGLLVTPRHLVGSGEQVSACPTSHIHVHTPNHLIPSRYESCPHSLAPHPLPHTPAPMNSIYPHRVCSTGELFVVGKNGALLGRLKREAGEGVGLAVAYAGLMFVPAESFGERMR